jgi:HlyD family secretion protein
MTTTSGTLTAPLGRLRRAGVRGLGPWHYASLLAVLIVMAVAGYTLFAAIWGTGQQAAPAYSIGTATRQTIASVVNASGTVSPVRQVKLSFATAGRVARLSVKQGDTVQEGQEIAALDTTTLQVQRDTAASQLAAARARLEAVLAGSTAADIAQQQQAVTTAQASVDRAKAALDKAQSDYDKLARGEDLTLRPEWAALNQAQAAYQQALTAYTNKLNPNPQDVAAAQAAVSSAQSALDAAQTKLNQLLNPNPQDVAAAQAAVTSAQAQLDAARAKYASVVIGGTLADVQAAQAAVDAAQAQLDAAMSKRSVVYATASSTDADRAAADAAVVQAQAALAQAKSNLAKLQGQQSGTDAAAAEQQVRAAETALAQAQNNLNQLLNPRPQDVAAAQQAVSQAQSQLDTARANLTKLLNPDPSDVAQLKAALDSAKAALDTAQTNWDRLVNKVDLNLRPEAVTLAQARADYNSAQAQLAAAQARLSQMLAGPLPTDVQQAQEAVNQAELALKTAQYNLDNAVLRAPFAGTVVQVSVNEGDQVGASTAVVTLLDPNQVRIDATLDESSVAQVKAGQQVLITFDALPGQQFQGQVVTVTPAGTTQQGVVTFPVTVTFNPRGVTIPTGATATLRIITERKDNVVAVPSRAIKVQGRTRTVDVILPDGRIESRPVQVGITGDNGLVEIVSGLQEGERVAIPTQQRAGQTAGTFGAGGLPGLGGGARPVGGGAGPVIITR